MALEFREEIMISLRNFIVKLKNGQVYFRIGEELLCIRSCEIVTITAPNRSVVIPYRNYLELIHDCKFMRVQTDPSESDLDRYLRMESQEDYEAFENELRVKVEELQRKLEMNADVSVGPY